jgi:hypothetical protein
MAATIISPQEYLDGLPADRKEIMTPLRNTIPQNLPEGFEECIHYEMLGYIVPHSKYPDSYHCDASNSLPFMNVASQKNNINFYHIGLYSDPSLLEWFKLEYPKHASNKLDMGKSCIRFKNTPKIPVALLGQLVSKMTADQWIEGYESVLKK